MESRSNRLIVQVVNDRFKLLSSATEIVQTTFADSVRSGLEAPAGHRTLEPRFFYDQDGSVIFEEITKLEEYYPTRCEASILAESHKEITGCMFGNSNSQAANSEPIMVELGSGSSVKTKTLIKSILDQKGKLLYIPIDISESMLRESAEQLLAEFPKLKVVGVAAEYMQGLQILAQEYSHRTKLILWLGSSIGTFIVFSNKPKIAELKRTTHIWTDRDGAGNLLRTESIQFLSAVKKTMTPSDRLLIGMDLKKDLKVLVRAYNDSLGVTAKFNKNLLVRINEQLGADFDLDSWRHESIWNETEGRIEMRLWSLKQQIVTIPKLDNLKVVFRAGESIHTENCHKYSLEDIERTAAQSGFEVDQQWFDSGNMFSLNLFQPLFSSS